MRAVRRNRSIFLAFCAAVALAAVGSDAGASPARPPAKATPPAAPATKAAPAAAAKDQAPASPVVAPADVTFNVDVKPAALAVGRRFTVTLTATFAAGTRLYFPEKPSVRPFVLVKHTHVTPDVEGSATTEVHALTLLPVRLGEAVLKPIEVPYVTAAGQARVASTPEVHVNIESTLGNETNPKLASAGAPVPVLVPNTLLVWGLSALGVALLAAAAGIFGYRRWRAWREAHRPPPPPRPAHEVAFERITAIEAMGLIETGDFKQLALLVSEVVREFLGARFGFAGVDLTTWEVMREVEGRQMGRMTPVELEDYLGMCDLVKFAKYQATVDDATGLLRRAREVVSRVMVVPEATTGGAA